MLDLRKKEIRETVLNLLLVGSPNRSSKETPHLPPSYSHRTFMTLTRKIRLFPQNDHTEGYGLTQGSWFQSVHPHLRAVEFNKKKLPPN